MAKRYTKAEIIKLPESEVEISVEVPFETLASYREKALTHLKERVTIPGFRKGKVPEKMIVERAGEMGVLEEAAEHLISDIYPEIIAAEKLDVIGRPEISVTSLAHNAPVAFKIKTALFPTFDLPDYKKIAREIFSKRESISVTDKEIEDVISEVRKMRAIKKEDGTEELPELTDELVKSMGPFESVVDFKTKLTENLKKEKEYRAKEKERLEMMGKMIEKSEISLPKILVEGEFQRMVAQFTEDVKRMGMTLTEYLAKIKKTESDLRKEWESDAKSRTKLELILDRIAVTEKIEADQKEVEKEVTHIVEHHSGANADRVRAYVEHQLRNEAVFKYLENQK